VLALWGKTFFENVFRETAFESYFCSYEILYVTFGADLLSEKVVPDLYKVIHHAKINIFFDGSKS
jgi:hypothetical protein